MSESTDTPPPEQSQDESLQPVEQQMTPPEQPEQPSKPAPADWRLIAIVAVAVAFLLAVFINKKFYDKKISTTTTTTLPSIAAPAQPAAPPPSRGDSYAAALRARELQARDWLYEGDGRLMLLARPPHSIAQGDDPRKIKEILPGRFLDVTNCSPGVRPEQFFRRFLFDGKSPPSWLFMDSSPALGMDSQIKMLFTPAAEATINVISDRQHVLGVTVGSESHAYPIALMNYHEVINDTIGGVPVVVTWSALAQCAGAWERTLPDKSVATFGSAGLIYQSAIVMYDVETHSLWGAVRGEPLAGARAGQPPLTPIQVTVTTWKAWKESAPQTLVLTGTEPLLDFNYEKNPAIPSDYGRSDYIVYPVYGFDVEKNPLSPREPVYVVIGPEGKSAKAYVAHLLAKKAADGPFEDMVGGAPVTLEFDKDSLSLSAHTGDGRPLLTRTMYWIVCVGAYPNVELWEEETIRRDAANAAAGVTTTTTLPAAARAE